MENKTRSILSVAVGVIVFLFAAFGHTLELIAPPQEVNPSLSVGVGSIFCLVVLLFISALSKGQSKKNKKWWLLASGVFLVISMIVAFQYFSNLNEYTFRYPPETQVNLHVGGGNDFTIDANVRRDTLSNETIPQLVAAFGGPANTELVWKKESLDSAKTTLTLYYILLVLSIAIAIFCLTEGVLKKQSSVKFSGDK